MNNLIRLLALVFLGLVALFLGTHIANGISQAPKINSVDNPPIWLDWGRRVTTYLSRNKALPEVNFEPKKAIPETVELAEWLDLLESKENCSPTGTPDNGSPSYGAYCFKKATFLEKVKKHKKKYNLLPNAEEVEHINWLGDNKFQRELVKIVIKEEYHRVEGMWWTTITVKKLGLPPKIN